MDKNNLFIFVTKGGAVFDRTNGKNERIIFGKEYNATNGLLKFSSSSDKKVSVTRNSYAGKFAYTKELLETGLYIVTPLFVQPLPRTSKDVRILYNRVKNLLGKPKFKIIENQEFIKPVEIQFNAKNEEGVLETRFSIKINPELLRSEHIEEICNTIQNAAALDLHILLRNFNLENNREVILIINDEFIETSLLIEKHYKSKEQ
jgi:hypothetical protein